MRMPTLFSSFREREYLEVFPCTKRLAGESGISLGELLVGCRVEQNVKPPNDPHLLLLNMEHCARDQIHSGLSEFAPGRLVEGALKGTGDNEPQPLGKRADGVVFLDQHRCHVAEPSLIENGKEVLFLEPEVAINVIVDNGDQLAELLPNGLAGNVQRPIPKPAVDHFLQHVHSGKRVEMLLMKYAADFG